MGLFYSKMVLVLGFIVVALAGCQDKPMSSTAKAVAQVKQPKPGAAVKLISDAILFVNPNEILTTDIVLNIDEDVGELHLELSTSAGLALLDTPTNINLPLGQVQPVKIPVKLLATQAGRFYLNVQASITTANALSSRNLAVIVQVGETVEKSPQFKKPTGEQIISLPAQETISSP
jgi:hypothetical protein